MYWRKFFSPVLLLVTLVMALPGQAQDDDVVITFPSVTCHAYGVIDVRGTVNPPGLQSYFLEAAPVDPDTPEEAIRWLPVTLPRREPVEDGIIARWDTTLLPDGDYRLRLRIALVSGETRTEEIGPIGICNELAGPQEAPGAETGPSLQPVTPAPTEAGPPTETPTPTVEPTPTVVPRPNVTNDLPLPVGGHINTFNEQIIPQLRATGLTWLKWQIPFVAGDDSLLAVARDRISWTHQHGFLAMLSIKGDKDELGELGEEYYPLYADFVRRVAEFQPDAIQVWNEMNLDREWPQGKIDPRAYVELLRQAYEAIKSVDPSIKVITGAPAPTGAEGAFGLSRVWNDDRYYLGMANAGAANYADCIGIHYNEGIIHPRQQGGDPRGGYPTYYLPLMLQRAAFPFRDQNVSFCFSELGYLSPEGYGTLPSGFAWAANTSVAEQAEWLRDAIQIIAEREDIQVDLVIIWNLDFSNFEDDPQAGYAIFRPDGSCPACEAIAELRGTGG
ncbi:MAG: hypothetical protein DIU68_011560 [Chloroflexota bacterium]